VNQQDQQAIEELFQYLYKSAAQAGPRDPEAEALIQQRFQQAPPGLLYHMAQAMVAQQHTIQQARAQLAAYQQQGGGSPAGFGAPGPQGTGQPGYPAYGSPQYQQPGSYQPYQQGYQPPQGQPGQHGFLSGAGKLALGVGGGILGIEALRGLFDGGLFGGGDDRDYDRDRDFGFGDQDGGFDGGDGFDGGW
jgi:uncharacterized protein